MYCVKSQQPCILGVSIAGLAIIFITETIFAVITGSLLVQVSMISVLWALLNCVASIILTLVTGSGSRQLSFGYYRLSAIGTLFSIFLTWILSSFILAEYIESFSDPITESLPSYNTLIILASADVAAKLLVLKQIPDILISLTLYMGFLLVPLDNLVELIDVPVSLVLVCIVAAIPLRKCLRELMMATPHNIDIQSLYLALSGIESVQEVHDLHVWEIGESNLRFTCHMVALEHNEVLVRVEELLKESYNIKNTTVQLESPTIQRKSCKSCSTEASFLSTI